MIQNIPEGVDSKFRLVLLIARRAEQLIRGARPKIKTEWTLKPTRLAAEEFQEGEERREGRATGPPGPLHPTDGLLDVLHLGPAMREEDRAECEAAHEAREIRPDWESHSTTRSEYRRPR